MVREAVPGGAKEFSSTDGKSVGLEGKTSAPLPNMRFASDGYAAPIDEHSRPPGGQLFPFH